MNKVEILPGRTQADALREHEAVIDRLEQEQRQAAELEAISKPLCPDCRKRFGTVPCPDQYHRCQPCALAFARLLLKRARWERVEARREKRTSEAMALLKKRRAA